MTRLQIAVFNVGAGQSILIYPTEQPSHACLIDCGGEKEGFSPVAFLISKNILPINSYGRPQLGNLTLTNYDQDHFSWLPELRKRVDIWTTKLPKNISSQELIQNKSDITNALKEVCFLKDTYIFEVNNFLPKYQIYAYYLEQKDLNGDLNTNHLSQIVFIEFEDSIMCVSGDLERPVWEKILNNPDVGYRLSRTNVLIAPHHGRNNGYHEKIFENCNPELIIISDKDILYDTQGGMAQKYAEHVQGEGIDFNGETRKVLTTRSDGHILIEFGRQGIRSYTKLAI